MDMVLASRENTETTKSKQRRKLAESNRLIIMVVLHYDTSVLSEDHRNALSVALVANKISSTRSSEYIKLMKQIQQEQGSKEFADNFNRTRRVCESSAFDEAQTLKEF